MDKGFRVFLGSLSAATLLVLATIPAGAAGKLPWTPIAADGTSVYEWGQPVAPGGPGLVPTAVQAAAPQIDAGNKGDVLVDTGDHVWAWGGTSMVLREEPGVEDVVGRPVDGNGSFSVIEAPGLDSSCPASTTVVNWSPRKAPFVVLGLNCRNVVQLAKAASYSIALAEDGEVYVWGGSDTGGLGLGPTITKELNPTLNPYLSALTGGTATGVEITAGMSGGGLLVNGRAYAWGGDNHGQCGCGSTASVIPYPTAVSQGGVAFTWIDEGGDLSGNGHFLAEDTNGQIWAWGDNKQGQLGDGAKVDSNVPVEVLGLPGDIVDLRAGGQHSMALDAAGDVYTWGSNRYGQLGDGTTINATLPELVMTGASMISAGAQHSIAQ
ncbi:MAG: hypothetical protein WB808_13755 [Candidatus Dormiibacterota bacterium]